MREIKFRVWSERQKTYNYKHPYNTLGNFYINQNGCLFSDYGNAVTPEIRQKDFVFEQYTGLKDKNGKEIYEGDILQEELDFGDKMVDGLFIYLVKWDESCLCYKLDPDNASIHDELWMVNGSAKIIGNIHENPELLKGGKDERE